MTCYLAHISKASYKDQVVPCVVEAVRLRRAPLTTQFVDTLPSFSYRKGSELYLLELFSEFEIAFLATINTCSLYLTVSILCAFRHYCCCMFAR